MSSLYFKTDDIREQLVNRELFQKFSINFEHYPVASFAQDLACSALPRFGNLCIMCLCALTAFMNGVTVHKYG